MFHLSLSTLSAGRPPAEAAVEPALLADSSLSLPTGDHILEYGVHFQPDQPLINEAAPPPVRVERPASPSLSPKVTLRPNERVDRRSASSSATRTTRTGRWR